MYARRVYDRVTATTYAVVIYIYIYVCGILHRLKPNGNGPVSERLEYNRNSNIILIKKENEKTN